MRAKDSPFSVIVRPDGSKGVINHFVFELSNQSGRDRKLMFGIASEIASESDIEIVMANPAISIAKDQAGRADVFIRFPQAQLVNGRKSIRVFIRDFENHDPSEKAFYEEKEVPLVGPYS
jgi:hypothetical protein